MDMVSATFGRFLSRPLSRFRSSAGITLRLMMCANCFPGQYALNLIGQKDSSFETYNLSEHNTEQAFFSIRLNLLRTSKTNQELPTTNMRIPELYRRRVCTDELYDD